jgi:hypothetical protein
VTGTPGPIGGAESRLDLAVVPREVHHRAMTVVIVIASLLAVLAVACWWEARSGKPAWGAHLGPGGPDDARRDGGGATAWPRGGGGGGDVGMGGGNGD